MIFTRKTCWKFALTLLLTKFVKGNLFNWTQSEKPQATLDTGKWKINRVINWGWGKEADFLILKVEHKYSPFLNKVICHSADQATYLPNCVMLSKSQKRSCWWVQGIHQIKGHWIYVWYFKNWDYMETGWWDVIINKFFWVNWIAWVMFQLNIEIA